MVAALGLHHLRMVKTSALYLDCGTKTISESKLFRRHPGKLFHFKPECIILL
jgi:hypothetical protein